MGNRHLLPLLPSVEEVLNHLTSKDREELPHQILVQNIRNGIDGLRQQILQGELIDEENLTGKKIAQLAWEQAQQEWQPNLRPVINATGVVLHTNLGRAVLSAEARQAIQGITKGYSNLELNLDSGQRGSRYSHVVDLLCHLTGAESALVVNNNAAAVLLALNTFAQGKEVIVSRSQLVEIGGSFRVPDVMEASGAKLVEVGTTNKTYQGDYRRAITEETALLLKVHPSNYRIMGFTQETSLEELVALGQETGLPVMEDLGSGFLVDLKPYGITGEPTVQEELETGADIITFSGDKLLGGPQAGIIVGKKAYIDAMAQNQLTRALRVDKLTMSALEATLKTYLWEPEQAIAKIPILAMLTMQEEELAHRATQLAKQLEGIFQGQVAITLEKGVSQAGGGSLPMLELPTTLVALIPKKGQVHQWAACLRQGEPAVMARIADGKLLLDVRTVLPDEEESLRQALLRHLPS